MHYRHDSHRNQFAVISGQSCVSYERNYKLLPKQISIMLSCHIPNALCYRIFFFHLWWTPRLQSKQSDTALTLSLSLFFSHSPPVSLS